VCFLRNTNYWLILNSYFRRIFNIMYAFISSLRSYLFDNGVFKSSEFDLPIINVGNLAVGGSGKTPHIEYIIRLLNKEFNIATLSRGYGRKTKGYQEVSLESTANECGDEPLQIKNSFPNIRVFVGENRVEAITKLLFDYPHIDVILLDDAYQHRAIKAGLNILLTEYSKIFTRDKSMPLGRLREYPSAAKRADMVIITKSPTDISEKEKLELSNEISQFTNAPVLFSGINYSDFTAYNSIKNVGDIENILLISALANPKPMFDYLKSKYSPKNIEHIEFRDHHYFSDKDIYEFIQKFNSFAEQNKIIVISEKDAARLRVATKETAFEKLPVFILPIEVSFNADSKRIFNEKITNYVRENKADYNIHQ